MAAMISPSGPRLAGRYRRVAALLVDAGDRGRLRRHRRRLGGRRGAGGGGRPSGRRTARAGGCSAPCTSPRPRTRRSRSAPTASRTSPSTSARPASSPSATRSTPTGGARAFVERYADGGNIVIGTPDDAIAYIEGLLEQSGGFGTFLHARPRLGVSPRRRSRSYRLFAREVIPHFKHKLAAPAASHDWAAGKRDGAVRPGRPGDHERHHRATSRRRPPPRTSGS